MPPVHNRFLEALMRCPAHLIITLRAKTVTEQTRNEKGKPVVVDLGVFPRQRCDGEEFAYGLDISGRLDPEDQGVRLTITNTRYQAWHGASFLNPDEALGAELATWLDQGVAPTAVLSTCGGCCRQRQTGMHPGPPCLLGRPLRACDLGPTLESCPPLSAILRRGQQMPSQRARHFRSTTCPVQSIPTT
jgi:hypothetical protein